VPGDQASNDIVRTGMDFERGGGPWEGIFLTRISVLISILLTASLILGFAEVFGVPLERAATCLWSGCSTCPRNALASFSVAKVLIVRLPLVSRKSTINDSRFFAARRCPGALAHRHGYPSWLCNGASMSGRASAVWLWASCDRTRATA